MASPFCSQTTMRFCKGHCGTLVRSGIRPRAPTARRFHTVASPLRPKEPSLISFIVRTYQNGIQRYPLFTKVTMAVFIFSTSDVVTQKLLLSPTPSSRRKGTSNNEEEQAREVEEGDSETSVAWDVSRTMSAAVFGVASTTFLHYWWGLLEHSFARMLPLRHTHFVPTLAKVFVHQSCAAPFYIYSYYVLTNFLQQVLNIEQEEGAFSLARLDQVQQSWNSVHAKAQEMLWPTMLRHWSVWPFVQTANFYCISLHHRILVHNSVLMLWSGYLSYLNHHDRSSLHRNRSLFHDIYHYTGIWVSARRGGEDNACSEEDSPVTRSEARIPEAARTSSHAPIAARKTARDILPTT
jgi:Mpv17 / PMP22 family